MREFPSLIQIFGFIHHAMNDRRNLLFVQSSMSKFVLGNEVRCFGGGESLKNSRLLHVGIEFGINDDGSSGILEVPVRFLIC